MSETPLCECGQVQIIKHIVDILYCLTKYEGKTEGLLKGDTEALEWLRSLEVRL